MREAIKIVYSSGFCPDSIFSIESSPLNCLDDNEYVSSKSLAANESFKSFLELVD